MRLDPATSLAVGDVRRWGAACPAGPAAYGDCVVTWEKMSGHG
jgi:hypothetical protein